MIPPQVLGVAIPYGLHLYSRAENMLPTMAVLLLNAAAWWAAGWPLVSIANALAFLTCLLVYLVLRRAAHEYRERTHTFHLPPQDAGEQ